MSSIRFVLLFVAFVMMPGSAGLAQGAVPDYRAEFAAFTFVEDPCPVDIFSPEVEGETVTCGYLIVPEDHNDPNSPNIQLAVMTIESRAANASPVIYLEGGPGGGALASYEAWFESGLRGQHDLILIDQRGTGFSLPSLNCPEDAEFEDGLARCRRRLRGEGVNLDAYNSAQNAADIATLVDVLGTGQANLFGSSYGTRLALTVIRDHPDVVRSAIIDAVYPPNVAGYEEQGINGYSAFQALFRSCAADAACNNAFPNLERTFLRTAAELQDNPLLLDDGYGGADYDGSAFVNEIFGYMYEAEWIPYLPALIDAVNRRDVDAYLQIGPSSDDAGYGYYEEGYYEDGYYEDGYYDEGYYEDGYYEDGYYDEGYYEEGYYEDEGGSGRGGSESTIGHGFQDEVDDEAEGMFYSVECAEELPFNTLAGFRRTSDRLPPILNAIFSADLDVQFDQCAIWNVQAADDIESAPVVSDIPVLIMSGEFDPITPPIWGDVAAETLSNSYHFVFPGLGHGSVDVRECPTRIALDFLANPFDEPDSRCISAMPAPQFVIP